jgi:hypothetical protein
MSPVAKIVSDLFMLVISVLSVPSDVKEFRLDVIQHSGRVETILVRRTEAGFALLEQRGDKLVERGTILRVAGKPSSFALKLGDVPEQTFDFAAGIEDFTLDGLRKAQALTLKAKDGVGIHVFRSGGAVYLTPERGRITYACHRD